MTIKYNSTLSAPDAERGAQAQQGLFRCKWSAPTLCRFGFAFVFTLLGYSVKAQCPQGWDVGGGWGLKQGPTRIAMNINQSGTMLTGNASYEFSQAGTDGFLGIGKKYGATGTVGGAVEGSINADNFYVKIVWDNQTVGVYNGRISPQGQLTGTGYEIRSPSKQVSWFSDRTMKCASAAPVAPTNPTPKPIGRTGRGPKSAATPTPTPPRHKPNKNK